MSTQTHQEMVREFHEKFGLTINDTPTLSPKDDRLRVNLIHEEAMELWEAEEKNDRLGIADALGDLLYVIYGAGVTYGVPIDPKRGTDDGESLKADLIVYMNAGFAVRIASGDLLAAKNALGMALGAALVLADKYKLRMDAIFREIHRSNMSKAWKEQEIYEMENDSTRCETMKGYCIDEKADRGWIVRRRDGKVVKSPSTSFPNLIPLLDEMENT